MGARASLLVAALIALPAVAGDSGPTFTTAHGDVVPLETRPASDARVRVSNAGFLVRPATGPDRPTELTWTFALAIAPDAPAPTEVRIEDVTTAPAELRVHDTAPALDGRSWRALTPGMPVVEGGALEAWLRAPGLQHRVFRIEVGFADGSRSMLHQVTSFPYGARAAIFTLAKRNVAPAAEPRGSREPWQFSFDDREWTRGYEADDGDNSIREYVLRGESVEAWTELVTSQSFDRAGRARKHAENFRKLLLKKCPRAVVALMVRDEDDMIVEWRHEGCGASPAQHEMRRFASVRHSNYTLAYVAKVSRLDDATRSAWLARLRAAAIDVR